MYLRLCFNSEKSNHLELSFLGDEDNKNSPCDTESEIALTFTS